MQAVILAAGMGKRLKEHTKNQTKCMVQVGGMTLIERSLRILDQEGLSRIVLVTGYQADGLVEHVKSLGVQTPIVFVHNAEYETTSNLYSLLLAKEYLVQEDTLVIESDVIFEKALADRMLASEQPCLTFVSKPEPWMDGSLVTLDENGYIKKFINAENFRFEEKNQYYKTVSMYRLSGKYLRKTYLPFLEAYVRVWGKDTHYESALRVVAFQDKPTIATIVLQGEKWYEINDIQDMDIAESIFAEGDEKLTRYMRRFGGYWRYHGMHDFCYLVNPFFPNQRFMDEMKTNFETLIREYPSGMAVNSLLAAKYFELRPEQICVGNGTAELIKSLMENFSGRLGLIYPTFEEYPHRKKPEQLDPFWVINEDFSYTVDDIMAYYEERDVEAIVLVNPDNPSGHFIERNDLLRLEDWARAKNIHVIVDESFVDFADIPDQTLLTQEILDNHPNLIVLKSISKSFGVPGLRLGVLATADAQMIAAMKKDLAIWNINSFAEYYMQIIEKYKDDYEEAMQRFMGVRERYLAKLNTIPALRVFPSQANYVMCHLENGYSSRELADMLLNKYNILIKDLSTKEGLNGGNYIRLSVKTDEENDIVASVLADVLK